MKTTMVIIFLTIAMSTASANDEKYLETMRKNIEVIYKAQNLEEFRQAVNAFERIGNAKKSRWEPFYYASFGYIQMAILEPERAKKDTFLDQAAASLSKANEIISNNSEVIALEGFIYMIRVTVDPASRGAEYAPMAMQHFGKAIEINPENPRAFALMAQMQYGTAQFLGSPAIEACATLDMALEKFTSFKTDNPIAPQWGKLMAEELKKRCL